MLDVADHAHDGDVELRSLPPPLPRSAGQLRSAEYQESFREGQIHDCDLGLALGVGGGEFPARENGLMQRGEVSGRDARLLEVHVLVFAGLYPWTE